MSGVVHQFYVEFFKNHPCNSFNDHIEGLVELFLVDQLSPTPPLSFLHICPIRVGMPIIEIQLFNYSIIE